MEDDLKGKNSKYIKSRISKQLLVESSPHFKLRLISPKQTYQMPQMPEMEHDIKWNTTSNIKS